MEDNKLILSRLNDLSEQREKYNYTVFSKFVSLKEQQIAKKMKNISMLGGYEGAERKVIAFYPDYVNPETIEWPISTIKIIAADKTEYSHRDFLGSLIGLGIKREVLGDIIVTPDFALLFCLNTICEFIRQNLKTVSRSSVSCSLADLKDLRIPERKYEEITGSVASLRLDSVLSVAIGKSRSFSQEILSAGAVQLNYNEITDLSHIMNAGDILSVRGYGKFIFDGNSHISKKGRNIIKLRKYI
jgi:RNA-binding protein YlmH